jgi:hypothetical protein
MERSAWRRSGLLPMPGPGGAGENEHPRAARRTERRGGPEGEHGQVGPAGRTRGACPAAWERTIGATPDWRSPGRPVRPAVWPRLWRTAPHCVLEAPGPRGALRGRFEGSSSGPSRGISRHPDARRAPTGVRAIDRAEPSSGQHTGARITGGAAGNLPRSFVHPCDSARE